MSDFRTLFELILSIVTLVNTAMYWRVMERITKIEESTKGEIKLLTQLAEQTKETMDEMKDDLKQLIQKVK